MKTRGILNISAVVFMSALMAYAAPIGDPAIGQTAPDFTVKGSDGKNYRLADYRGKFVVLEWYNPGCPFVRKHYDTGNMQSLQDRYTKKGVVWLSIDSSATGMEGNLSAQEGQADRAQNKAHSTALLLDPNGTVGRLYGAKTTPHMFVIDPKGVLDYKGAIDNRRSTDPEDIAGATNYVALALDEAMAGKPVTTVSTRSYGCSVKYNHD